MFGIFVWDIYLYILYMFFCFVSKGDVWCGLMSGWVGSKSERCDKFLRVVMLESLVFYLCYLIIEMVG